MITLIIPTTEIARGEAATERAIQSAGSPAVSRVILDHRGDGFTRTVNRGLELAWEDGDDVCLLNDDCQPESDRWLRKLATVARSREDAWFVGPSGPCRTPPQNSGRPDDGRKPRYVSHLAGFCLYARRQVLESVGLLNESLIHYGSDVDWQWRAREMGGRSVWVPYVYVNHELHQPRQPWWNEDNERFNKIWR